MPSNLIRWSKYNLLMLNMVLHTWSIHLIAHSQGNTQRGQVFVLVLYFGKYAYHFRHIVEMFWTLMHMKQVSKVWALQNRWEPCILWHSSRETDSKIEDIRIRHPLHKPTMTTLLHRHKSTNSGCSPRDIVLDPLDEGPRKQKQNTIKTDGVIRPWPKNIIYFQGFQLICAISKILTAHLASSGQVL